MTQDRPKVHPKWILITLLSRWGWKNAPTLLRRQFFHGIYSVFCTSHIPKAACNIAPKIQKLSSHAGKTRSFYANASPQTCARSNFSCNLQCFFPHFQHRFWPPKVYKSPCPPHPPPWLPQKKRLSVSNAFCHQASQVPFSKIQYGQCGRPARYPESEYWRHRPFPSEAGQCMATPLGSPCGHHLVLNFETHGIRY